jgi:predicted HTH domain antitoxin
MKKQKYKIRTVCSLNEDLNLKLNVNLITNGKTIFSKCTVLSELI